MKLIKKIAIILFFIILFLAMTCEPKEPEGDVYPYMSDVSYIPQKVYAKGKPQRSKVKRLLAYDYIGKFTLTAYCGCSKCSSGTGITASGRKVKANHTIAVDTRVIPFDTKVLIGDQEYIAEDTGSAIKGNKIDIYFESHEEAEKFGVKKNVKIYKRRKLVEVLGIAKRDDFGEISNGIVFTQYSQSR